MAEDRKNKGDISPDDQPRDWLPGMTDEQRTRLLGIVLKADEELAMEKEKRVKEKLPDNPDQYPWGAEEETRFRAGRDAPTSLPDLACEKCDGSGFVNNEVYCDCRYQ